jgi:hypothetical protein
MKVKRMGITEILRRIWLFSANKIKSSESVSKQLTQLIVKLNSSLRQKLGTLVVFPQAMQSQSEIQFKNSISFTGDLNLRILILFFTKIGATIKIVTDDQYKEKCTKDILWVDYKNISKVLVPGARIFIDDGLISVIAKECGPDYVIGEIENSGNLGSKKGTFQSMHNLRLNMSKT